MKSKYSIIVSILVLTSICFFSCKKEESDAEKLAKLNSEIMEWMYDAMDEVYFWNSTIPAYSLVKNETDPKAFFESLIYTQEDRWSWLTEDYASLMEEFDGTPTSMGISPAFGRFSGTDKVFIIVSYVYPGSPAERAGIERGDIIIKINGAELTTANYYDLFDQNSYTVTLGHYFNGSISESSNVVSLTAEIIDSNPIVFDTILEINSHKIAYMVYVEFISGENDILLDDFGMQIDEFKSQGITDLIIDLRYNPGGEITAANYLASCLAPLSVVSDKEIFVEFIYNPEIQLYFENYYGSDSENLVNRFKSTGHNIDLNRIYFITSDNSASASELLMIGLEPYMEVIQVGDTTYGKYTGAWVLADTNEPPKHNWAIVPIVSKYSNSAGFTDFKNGLYPDYALDDELLGAKQFGDLEDPMLGKAVELITGNPAPFKKSFANPILYQKLRYPSQNIKTNLFLPKPIYK